MAEDGWYYEDRGENRGPVEMATLRRLAMVGAIDAETLVWREGMQGWEPARLHVPGVRPPRSVFVPGAGPWPLVRPVMQVGPTASRSGWAPR